MNKPKASKLNHTEQEQLAAHEQQSTQQAALEVSSPEELIRHDANQTQVPPTLVERLRASIASEPRTDRPWWRRFLGQPG